MPPEIPKGMTMANDDEKTTVQPGAEDPAAPTPPKKGNKKLILFGGIGLGAVILGVLLTVLVIKPMVSGSHGSGEEPAKAEKADNKEEKEEHKSEAKKPAKKETREGEAGPLIYTIKDIVVNPAGTGGSRFLSVSFGFELESPELQTLFEEREPIIRDALITVLSSKTVAQLTDPKEKEIVRFQIKKRLSQLMGTTDLAGVYYTDFVLQ
jgi:flagellar FliL protein